MTEAPVKPSEKVGVPIIPCPVCGAKTQVEHYTSTIGDGPPRLMRRVRCLRTKWGAKDSGIHARCKPFVIEIRTSERNEAGGEENA